MVEINEKQEFTDEKGNIVTQPIYDWAWSFSEDVARGLINDKIIHEQDLKNGFGNDLYTCDQSRR